MVELADYRAISQSFNELAKFIYCGISSYGIFITLVFRVALFKEPLYISQMMHTFKLGGTRKCNNIAN